MGATLTLINSTVSGNSTGLESDGGGIYNDYTGNVTLINSTVSGNEADNKGGGIYNSDGTLTLINSTVSNNEARSYGGIANEVYFEGAGVFMINTIVAQNTATEGPDCGFYGPLTSQGYNLIGNGRDCDFIAASGDLVGTDESPIDPLLGPLQDNGGPTETHALLEGSPAIDAIPVADCNDTFDVPITADQRGVTKPQGPACDMGAFELEQAEFTVDSTVDVADANLGDGVCDDGSGNCTLRAANQEANALGGQNIINLPAGTYNLSSSIAIESDLTIFGAGPADTIIVGGGEFSFIVFEILLDNTEAISDLTVQNGTLGVYVKSQGTFTLTNVTVTDNVIRGISNNGVGTLIDSTVSNHQHEAFGNGIENSGTLTLINSTASGNYADIESVGGGIYNTNAGIVTLINSTVSDNKADHEGGGIFNSGTVILINSTVINNSDGGGIYNDEVFENAVVLLVNTIVAQNTGSFDPDCYSNVPVTSLGYNLIGDATGCNFVATIGDLVGDAANPIDPLLGPLQDNGGSTETHALLAGSPAIDAIPVADCNDNLGEPVTTDQRGFARPQGTACDIGSFELEGVIEEATRFDVQLNGDGVVPAVDTAARGRGRFKLDANETGIRGALLVGDILGVTAAHIHCGLTGETGPVGITLVELACWQPAKVGHFC